jgi:hypothetical protein
MMDTSCTCEVSIFFETDVVQVKTKGFFETVKCNYSRERGILKCYFFFSEFARSE